MGIALWIAAGLLAFAVARIVPLSRPRRWLLELIVALLAAVAAGAVATAADFGGWKELDWRAGSFALAVSLAAAGVLRAARGRRAKESSGPRPR